MEHKEDLPRYCPVDDSISSRRPLRRRRNRRRHAIRLLLLTLITYTIYAQWMQRPVQVNVKQSASPLSVDRLLKDHAHCSKLRAVPKDPSGPRERSARFNGANPVLIKGATVWTGEPVAGTTPEEARTGKGLAWEQVDVLLQDGLIKRVASDVADSDLPKNYEVRNGTGRLLTAGIIDMHTHASVSPLPDTRGGSDDNELSSDTTPYVRSLDAINPLDPQIKVIKSGGVTTSLVLPGSGNNIGGEAFVIKHAVGKHDGRPELSADSMLADPEQNWRYMKMACGENAKRVYGRVGRDFGPFSRMGEAWYFRHAFEQARELVTAQDEWCAAADQFGPESMSGYLPLDLKWESLSAVLRGQVHVNTHCYTVPDLEAFIRHTSEFKFPVRAFHHAHQTYLVPEILKRNYGGRPPAAALFADNMYYKTEAYIGSEQAGKILHENGITPVYVSDNPVLNAQHVVFEAAKAHMYGLPYHAALEGVTSAPAELLGLGERIGKIKEGFDADVVLWDSDPLSVGATPVQVWIDGAAQFNDPFELEKGPAHPLEPEITRDELSGSVASYEKVCFSGIVANLMSEDHRHLTNVSLSVDGQSNSAGGIDTFQWQTKCDGEDGRKEISLKNGYVVRPATAFGSYLGLEEISAEESTNDGGNTAESFSAAVDGLSLDTKSLRAAFAHGITRAISAPPFAGMGHKGSSVGFRVNAKHALEDGAVWKSVVSVHYPLTLDVKQGKTPSMSSAIGELKVKLLKAVQGDEGKQDPSYERADLAAVVKGRLPLVISVHKADIIATLINMKRVVDLLIAQEWKGKGPAPRLRLVILGGAESHIVAQELAEADIGVVMAPPFPYATLWDQRRSLTGAPLTNGTGIDVLHAAGVKVAIGTSEDWETRDLYLMAGIVHRNSGGRINGTQALDMLSGNIYDMLGLQEPNSERSFREEMVIFEGNPLEIQSRVRAVYDGTGKIHVWE